MGRGHRRRNRPADNTQELLVGGVIAAALVWVFVVEPGLRWAIANWPITILGVVGLAAGGYKLFRWHGSRRREVEEARRREVGNLVVDLEDAIRAFQPSRRYGNEFGYHTELQGWLKSRFSAAKVEIQTGASRPDIVVGPVAIEVKGPTDTNALNTLTTKCLKYGQYYKHLIIVLFEPRFSEQNYNEIVAGINARLPGVTVIRKD